MDQFIVQVIVDRELDGFEFINWFNGVVLSSFLYINMFSDFWF